MSYLKTYLYIARLRLALERKGKGVLPLIILKINLNSVLIQKLLKFDVDSCVVWSEILHFAETILIV